MRFIPTKVHGIADYVVGFIVIYLPIYFGWTGAQEWSFLLLGAFVLIYSLATDYELGAFPLVSFSTHRMLDVAFGILMLALPWVLSISRDGLVFASAIGFLALLLTALTQATPSTV